MTQTSREGTEHAKLRKLDSTIWRKDKEEYTVKGWDAGKKKPKGASGQPAGKPGNGKEPRDFHLVGTKAKKL